MSSSREISEVYNSDINNQTLLVVRKRGLAPFLAGNHAFHIESMFGPACGDGENVRDWVRPDASDEEEY